MSSKLSPQKSMCKTKRTKASYISSENQFKQDSEEIFKFQCDLQTWIPQWNTLPQNFLFDLNQSKHLFCPYCGHYIQILDDVVGCKFRNPNKTYMAHLECVSFSATSLSQSIKDIQQLKISYKKMPRIERILALSQKQYFVKISATHPISSYMYFKDHKRLIYNGKSIIWNMNDSIGQFQPNMICLPLSEFKLVIDIEEISDSKPNRKTMKLYVDLSEVPDDTNIVTIESQGSQIKFKGQFNLYVQNKQKAQMIGQLNYKYKFSADLDEKLVRFNRFQLFMQDHSNTSSQNQQSITQINYQKLIYQNQIEEFQLNPEQIKMPKTQTNLFLNIPNFKDYACSHSGSKQLQKTIPYMKPQQIDAIISQLYCNLPEIIAHQYGNYMFQSLIVVCTLQQRLKILENLKMNVCDLVCTKQGTFSLQEFITYFTQEKQFNLICESIQERFVDLCMDHQGTHFIRKLIKIFPPCLLLNFAQSILANLLRLSVDKNAVCVLKIFIKVLNNIEGNHQLIQVRKNLISILTSNSNYIIQDQYGNYLIQQCYQIFGEDQLKGITQMIIDHFVNLAMHKYASKVLIKAIKQYWKNMYVFQQLKKLLKNSEISLMFKSRQGNPVLLEIMDHWEDFPLKNKIQQIVSQNPSKFNSQKWLQSTRKSRTQQVGTMYTSFSDAIKYKQSPPQMRKRNHKVYNK